jgi:hypothetical protein
MVDMTNGAVVKSNQRICSNLRLVIGWLVGNGVPQNTWVTEISN